MSKIYTFDTKLQYKIITLKKKKINNLKQNKKQQSVCM